MVFVSMLVQKINFSLMSWIYLFIKNSFFYVEINESDTH